MKVYLNGERPRAAAQYVVHVSPAGHLQSVERDSEMPREWVTETNEPKTFPVTFAYGAAEVPSNLGDYMVKYGLAQKSRLIIPDGVKVA